MYKNVVSIFMFILTFSYKWVCGRFAYLSVFHLNSSEICNIVANACLFARELLCTCMYTEFTIKRGLTSI